MRWLGDIDAITYYTVKWYVLSKNGQVEIRIEPFIDLLNRVVDTSLSGKNANPVLRLLIITALVPTKYPLPLIISKCL